MRKGKAASAGVRSADRRLTHNFRPSLVRNRRDVLMSEPPDVAIQGFDPAHLDVARGFERRMRGMSRKLQQVFERHVLGGESIREIAAELGVKVAAVYKRVKRARGWMGWG